MDIAKIESIAALQLILNGQAKDGKIFLFGAGNQCKTIYDLLGSKSSIGGIIDSYKSGYFENIPIKSFNEISMQICNKDIILVTVIDTKAIVEILEEHNFSNYLICSFPWYVSFYKSVKLVGMLEDVVEFYLVDAFEVFHFAPIVRFLNHHGIAARIVAEPQNINTVGNWFDYETAIKYLEKEELEFDTVCNPWARWAVTTQGAACLGKYFNKKINMAYGVTLLKNIFLTSKESCDGFDYKWVHGNYQLKGASRYIDISKIYKIGYPKYLPKWSKQKENLLFENTNGKPILAYFPTWDEYSSIKTFYHQIKELRKDYYIVAKMHHCTERLKEKHEDRLLLEEICDTVLSSEVRTDQFIRTVDIILADAKTGAASELVFLCPNVRLILLWPFDENIKKMYERFPDWMPQFARILTPFNSIKEELVQKDHAKETRRVILNDLYEPVKEKPLESILEIFLKS